MSALFGLFLAVFGLVHPAMANASSTWVATTFGIDPVIPQAADCTIGGLAIIGLLLAAASVAGIVVPGSWARPLIVVSCVASALMLAIDFGPLAVPGLVVDAALVWIALATPAALAGVFSH